MTTRILTAGILGLDANGQLLLEAAHRSGCFHIQAVADPDRQRAERTAAEFKCESFTDYRQLVVQNQLDCLLVAADIHTCDEQLRAALKKRFHVLKLAPPARNFEEAFGYVQMAENESATFAIANPGRFMGSYRMVRQLIESDCIGQPHLVTIQCRARGADRMPWRADPKLAGGGVLLHQSYHALDLVLSLFPLPQQVYALTSNQAPDKQQRLYLTEDTAVVSLKFSDALTGSVTAMQRADISTTESLVCIYGKDAVLTATDNTVILRASGDSEEQTWQFAETPHDVMLRMVSNFANSILRPDQSELRSSAAENLRNVAVLESAYLSARTGFPEEPARIPQMSGASAGAATNL